MHVHAFNTTSDLVEILANAENNQSNNNSAFTLVCAVL